MRGAAGCGTAGLSRALGATLRSLVPSHDDPSLTHSASERPSATDLMCCSSTELSGRTEA
eukprot:CAMPEP_0168368664 /NCGR_PEP_ID=MMETSP0228-20121227/6366_1 /TAXON_ID=133427 /ORGANISM="Protoceratium reticulatum, Strain CCCM 535 (=CCMP 1889)" /LENGTH=59 /DNA_ID=CAMNT_0008381515 /DNA_START=206 /DNA_END=386 /DNA_ORIENTATION=+